MNRICRSHMTMTLVVIAAWVACSGVAGADGQSGTAEFPLQDLNGSGRAPEIEKTDDGFSIKCEGGLTATVDMPEDAFLCRVNPGENTDIAQFSVGRVESRRCNALYSPGADRAIAFDGEGLAIHWTGTDYQLRAEGDFAITAYTDFMKEERGIEFFRPVDKSVFDRAPAGWCSWYIYYQGITQEHIVKNTDWLAENLRKFGCEYVQIDDGWQGVGHGGGENRDWYTTYTESFPKSMKWLAGYIESKGFKPGIWVIPFSTSDEEFFEENREMFITRPDGTSIYESRAPETGNVDINWTGRYIVDPTHEKGQRWFRDLFDMLCIDWGYDYVKIDGQGGSRGACNQWHDQLANPKLSGDEAYRAGLDAMKSVMGPNRFLLNCGGQYESCGYCEGIRTGGDVGASWSRMQAAIRATMEHVYLNNIAFWTDPDVLCVRPPLTLDQARVWATLYGITGQLLMASDEMYSLPEERVELLRRVFPPADIRPMDLYPLRARPRVFDLRIAKPGAGNWDVVALFNWNVRHPEQVHISPRQLGLPDGEYLYYDAWEKQLLGPGQDGLSIALSPTSCRVIVMRPLRDHPQILGTSRHITQGADDLIEANWDAEEGIWSGRSKVVAGDPYEIRYSLPPGWTCASKAAKLQGQVAAQTIESADNQEVSWQMKFDREEAVGAAPVVTEAAIEEVDRAVKITWSGDNAIAYRLWRNGEAYTRVVGDEFTDHPRRKDKVYRYEVSAIGWDAESPRRLAGEFTVPTTPRGTAEDIWLEDAGPELMISHSQDWGHLSKGRSVEGNPIRIAGEEYDHGLGTHANGEILLLLRNCYSRFQAQVGVDDEKGGLGSVRFQVIADGEVLFDSGPMRGDQPAKEIDIPLKGVDELLLKVTDAGDGINCDHADWAEARLIGND